MLRSSLVAASVFACMPASAGVVTVTGGGSSQIFSQVTDAMAWISDPSRASTQFQVHASSGSYQAFDVASNATLTWGNSPGLLEMVGPRQGPAVIGGTLLFELAGTSNVGVYGGSTPQYDVLTVDAASTLYTGNLLVSLINGFTPQLGDRFQLLVTAGTLQWQGSLLAPELADGLRWSVGVGDNGPDTPFEGGQSLYLTLTVVPVPGAAWVLPAMACLARRRRM